MKLLIENSFAGLFREIVEMIGKSDEVLQRNSAHLNTVLETLDINQHSLGVLAVLVAKYATPQVWILHESKRMLAYTFFIFCYIKFSTYF